MKRIAFFMQKMTSGGVEIALLHLLEKIKDNNISVDLYFIEKSGVNLSKIPSYVNVKEIPMINSERAVLPIGGWKESIYNNLKKHSYLNVVGIIIKKFFSYKKNFAELCFNEKNILSLMESYDLVVNYHIHSPFLLWYCVTKVKSNTKVAWIHNDFKSTHYDILKLKEYVGKYDCFYCVCNQNKAEFIELFPELTDKSRVASNLFDLDMIPKSNLYYPPELKNTNGNIILTVARLNYDKGIDLLIEAAEKLVKDKENFTWLVVGEGSDKSKFKSLIKRRSLDSFVKLVGFKSNPYPYFKHCNIYVQTSRTEGYVTTVVEAKNFNKPIVCTNVCGSVEQLEYGKLGLICDINSDSIYKSVKLLLNDKELCNDLVRNLKNNQKAYDYNWLEIFKGD